MKTQHGDDPLLANSGSSSAVIGPQFCAPNCEVNLTIITDDNGKFVSVKDVKGNIVFHIKDETTLVHERRHLLDVVGNHVITLQRKKKSIHKKWKVYKGDKKHSKDLLFSARGPSSVDKFPTKLLEVFLAKNPSKDGCDFTVIGSWLERSFTFYAVDRNSNVNTIIAQMQTKQIGTENKKKLGDEKEFSKDMSINVTVYPKIDYGFIIAIIVILDAISDDDKSSRGRHKENDNTSSRKEKTIAINFATSIISIVGATLGVAANLAKQ